MFFRCAVLEWNKVHVEVIKIATNFMNQIQKTLKNGGVKNDLHI